MTLSFVYKVLRTLSQILTGIDLPCELSLGRRFKIDHFGDDVVIRNGVTVGLRHTGSAALR